jgi:hypothetical protein
VRENDQERIIRLATERKEFGGRNSRKIKETDMLIYENVCREFGMDKLVLEFGRPPNIQKIIP